MLSAPLITMAWCVLRLQTQGTVSKHGG